MSHVAALEASGILAGLLALIHVLSPYARERSRERSVVIGPLSSGAVAAYIFLHLLPSIDEGTDEFGWMVTILAMAGFVAYYGVEVYVEDNSSSLFSVKVAVGWAYSFLIIYSLPVAFEENPVAALVVALALGLHVLQADSRLGWGEPDQFDRWGRYVLATAPVLAVAVDAALGDPSAEVSAGLSAFVAGMLLIGLFRDELGDRQNANFPLFLVGLAVYGGLVALEGVVG